MGAFAAVKVTDGIAIVDAGRIAKWVHYVFLSRVLASSWRETGFTIAMDWLMC